MFLEKATAGTKTLICQQLSDLFFALVLQFGTAFVWEMVLARAPSPSLISVNRTMRSKTITFSPPLRRICFNQS